MSSTDPNTNDPSDADLLAAYCVGQSPEVLEQIVPRHAPMVYAVCKRVLGDEHAAEDAAQATFLAFTQKADRLSKKTVLSGWLYLTALQAARQYQRSRKRRALHERRAGTMRAEAQLKASPDWEDIRPELDSALARLPKVQREAIVVRFLVGWGRAQAAAALNCPEQTLDTRVERGLVRLRALLARQGVVLPSALISIMLTTNAVEAAPPALVAAIHAACMGKGAASAIVLKLAKGITTAMFWAKVKVTTLTTVAASVLLGSALVVAVQGREPGMLTRTDDQGATIGGGVETTPVHAELAAIVESADVVAIIAVHKMEFAHIPDSYTMEKVFTGTIRRSFRLPERFSVGREITFGYVQFSRTDVNEIHVDGRWPFANSGRYLVALRRWNQTDFGPVPKGTTEAGWKPTAAYTFVSREKTCWWPADSSEAQFVESLLAQ